MESQRVGHDRVTMHACMHFLRESLPDILVSLVLLINSLIFMYGIIRLYKQVFSYVLMHLIDIPHKFQEASRSCLWLSDLKDLLLSGAKPAGWGDPYEL